MIGGLKHRHLLLGAALLATLAAVVWVSGREPAEEAVPVAPRRERPPAVPGAPSGPAADSLPAPPTPLQPRTASEGEVVNLFPRQSWFVPPPPPPPQAPPLPFAYLGKVINGNEVLVFVSSGDQNFAVHKGDILNGAYRIDDIAPPTMTVTYLPLNQKQTLEIGRAK